MERGRVDERDADLVEDRGDPVRRQGEVDAKLCKHIRGAGGGGCPPVSVLDDGNSGGRGNDRGDGRDVEHGPERVATGSDDVEHHRVDVEGNRVPQHRIPEADDLIDRLALDTQGDEKPSQLSGGCLPCHHLVHGPAGLRDGQIGARDEGLENTGPGWVGRHARNPSEHTIEHRPKGEKEGWP